MAKSKTDTNRSVSAPWKRQSLWNPLWLVGRVLHGQVVSINFFARYWLLIVIGVMVILVYITNKYNCQRAMEDIKELNIQLEVARTEAVREKSTYMSRITEHSMQRKLDSLGLDLKVQDQPPFLITSPK